MNRNNESIPPLRWARQVPVTLLCGVVVSILAAVFCIGLAVVGKLMFKSFVQDGRIDLNAWLTVVEDIPRWSTLLTNSLIVGGLSCLVSMIAGLALATLSYKVTWPGRKMLLILVMCWLCVPMYVTSSGLLSYWSIGALTESAIAAGLIHGILNIPVAAIILGPGLLYADPLAENSALLELRPWQVFWHMTIPRATWSLIAAAMILFMLVVTDYSITDILQVRTFAEEIYTQYQLKGSRTAPFIMSLPMAITSATILCILVRRARLLGGPWFRSQTRAPLRLHLARRGQVIAWLVVLVVLAFMLACMGKLFIQLESPSRVMISLKSIAPDWATTIKISIMTAVLTAPPALCLAWFLKQRGLKKYTTALLLLSLAAIPAPSLAMTLIELLNQPSPPWVLSTLQLVGIHVDPLTWVYDTTAIYVVGIGLRLIPIVTLVVLPAVLRVTTAMEDAAQLDGANWFVKLLQVYWPNCKNNIILAGLLTIVLSIAELDIAHLVAPPGAPTLSVRFFTLVHYGLGAEVATVCFAATLTALLPAILIARRVNRQLN